MAAVALAATGMLNPGAAVAAPVAPSDPETTGARQDDFSHPAGERQRAITQAAMDQLAAGKAKVTTNAKGKRVIEVAKGKYVNYDVNRKEAVLTLLVEFGTQTCSPQGGTPGPLHNQIPQPDRANDNSTIWQADYNREHYLNLMFGATNSFKDFYLKQSLGRFEASGDVSNWVKLPYNEACYGHNPTDGDGTSEGSQYWQYVKDSVTAWYDAQRAAGESEADIKAYLSQFDKVDRYDYNDNGDFNEPDGYVDHIQIIHAGEGEEAGGGAQGEDAIWSHRWYAYPTDQGNTGPAINKLGGTPIGGSGIWVGDYTTEPENGGLGVFTHEFGHDLGLPDMYDTAGGDNGTGFWTLMSAGSWLNNGTVDIGSEPGYMGPWEKIFLGWTDVRTIQYGQDTKLKLGPADRDAKQNPQTLLVNLPRKTVSISYPTPHSGTMEWWSGTGDNVNNTLTRSINLTGKSSATVSAWVANQTEAEYDYLYAEVSTDGATWTKVSPDLDGVSDWREVTWDLSAYAGRQISFRFRYATDGGVSLPGGFYDDIVVTADGATLFNDNVESGDNGWVAKGFTRINGTVTKDYAQYYLAENRVYSGYDAYLKTGPYNFGWADTRPDWVERFPYQNGLLVWFCDSSQKDNNTRVHPGYGRALPVDARPTPIVFPDGRLLGNRRQPFDATFGLERTDPVTFHRNGTAVAVPAQEPIPRFDDTDPNRYWSAANPMGSTKVAGSGTTITVQSDSKQGNEMQIQVGFTK